MSDHYHGFSHPMLDLAPQATTNLFDEMDQIADELRQNEHFIADDLQIAFRQLQKLRLPNLSVTEFHDLFDVWRDRYRAQAP